ncbi:hypothetical protein P22_0192 [Propionispora sp. 2/2-37]|uniref:TetR family transcriptional regulator n=1 Tax=Propionispora sp. 2/2-37 TaxID=1677858 RepID=UPI0006BB7B20|nr:TetR family transcriptional regulator [Propionispora sp. 2/2-37]CUH94130.1 hypothetical protein P22_0192 [Propionispora sp. 2/2-37]
MEKDTRIKMIQSATPLFARKGFAGVSIRELAEAAKVNSALIAYHFGNKEGLYAAVLDEQFRPISGMLENASLRKMNPLEVILYYTESVYAIHKSSPFLIRFLHSELTNPTACFDTVVKRYIGQIYPFLYKTFEEGVNSGYFSADLNPNYAVLSLAGILNFYFIAKPMAMEFWPQEQVQDQSYLMQAVRIYLNGVKRRQ